MICERCFRPLDDGDHGLYVCPLQPRPAHYVIPDDIPGGLLVEHGPVNADGSPKRYYSQSSLTHACEVQGYRRWADHYDGEGKTKDARVQMDWQRSGEAQRLTKQNLERKHDTERAGR